MYTLMPPVINISLTFHNCSIYLYPASRISFAKVPDFVYFMPTIILERSFGLQHISFHFFVRCIFNMTEMHCKQFKSYHDYHDLNKKVLFPCKLRLLLKSDFYHKKQLRLNSPCQYSTLKVFFKVICLSQLSVAQAILLQKQKQAPSNIAT